MLQKSKEESFQKEGRGSGVSAATETLGRIRVEDRWPSQLDIHFITFKIIQLTCEQGRSWGSHNPLNS